MNFPIIKCVIIFLMTGYSLIYSQQFLPSENVNSSYTINSVSSPSGFLYVASKKGISKYDGYRFINLSPQKAIWSSLFIDGDFIYYQDIEGLKKLNTSIDSTSVILKNKFTDQDPNNDHFTNIFVDSQGRIWSTDFNYVKYWSKQEQKLKTFLINSENKDLNKFSIFEPSENEVWIASTFGLFMWKEDTNTLQPYFDEQLSTLKYSSGYFTENSTVLLATEDGKIIEVNPKKKTFIVRNSLPENEIARGFFSKEKNVFVYTSKRIFQVKNESYIEIFNSEKNRINNVHFDKNTSVIWISTDKGLIKLPPVNPGIVILKSPIPDSKENNIISIIESSQSTIWVLNETGEVWKIDKGIWSLRFRNESIKCYTLNLIGKDVVLSTNVGLYILKENAFREIPLKEFSEGGIIKVLEISPQEIWVVFSHKRIKRYSWPEIQPLPDKFSNEEDFWKENQWNDILMDKEGIIWLAGWMPKGFGINRYDPVNHYFTDVSRKSINKDKSVFVGDYYNRIALSNSSNLLFSAYGGFNEADENGKIIKKVDINEYAISDSHIEGISADSNGNIFLATAAGLNVYRNNLDKVVPILKEDGIPTENLLNAFTMLKNGHLALGISNGIAIINPEKTLQSQLQNKLSISRIKINGTLQNSIKNNIELSKNQTDLTVYFSDLSFLDPIKVNYEYRFIEDKNWIDLGHNPELSLNHISPGKYHIQVRCKDNLLNTQQKMLTITVLANPPFFKSNLFYILLLLLIIAFVLFIQKYLTARKQKDAAYQQKIKETEMQMLRSQMNPHFMFNTLNSINSYIIQNKTEDASAYLTTFSKLMRNILQNSKEQWITLENELQTLKLYIDLESARLEHSFSYQIIVDNDVDEDRIKVPPLIIQPFVENSIWHGLRNKRETGNLIISVRKAGEDHLQISIEDNGVGREKSAQLKTNQVSHKSFGMEITNDRLKMLDPENSINIEDLSDGKNIALGTKVILTIKISDND